MFGLNGWELIIVLIVVLVIFGPKRLPEMGRSLGRAIKEFRNAGKEIQRDIAESVDEAERHSTAPANRRDSTTPADTRDSATPANKTI